MDMDARAVPSEWEKAFPDADFPTSGTNEDFYRAMEASFRDLMYSRWEAAEAAMEIIESMGYDGITHIGGGRTNKADPTRHRVFIAFRSEQIKARDNLKPTDDPDIRYSERSFSYEAIISKPDMVLTLVPERIPERRAEVIAQAKENAKQFGRTDPETGGVFVHVKDIDRDVLLGTNGLKHGLDRRFAENSPVTLAAGEILSHAIQINEANPRDNADASYILLGAAKDADGNLSIVRFVVNKYSNELSSVDVLYAINTKKWNRLRSMRPGFQGPVTDSTISIANLLDYVNVFFPGILPEDILRHYGHESRPADKLGESMLYQDRAEGSLSHRTILANAFEGVAQTELERKRLEEYRAKIRTIEEAERTLYGINEDIRQLMEKMSRDTGTEEDRKRLPVFDFT